MDNEEVVLRMSVEVAKRDLFLINTLFQALHGALQLTLFGLMLLSDRMQFCL